MRVGKQYKMAMRWPHDRKVLFTNCFFGLVIAELKSQELSSSSSMELSDSGVPRDQKRIELRLATTLYRPLRSPRLSSGVARRVPGSPFENGSTLRKDILRLATGGRSSEKMTKQLGDHAVISDPQQTTVKQ